jgi:hypothetical protein
MRMWVVVGWVQYSVSVLVFISLVLQQILSEPFVCLYQSLYHHILEGYSLNVYQHENLKS